MPGPGSACGRTTTPSRPATPAAACRCGCRPPRWRCSTGRGWWPGTSGRPGKYAEILVLDHYLEVLQRKPGALPGATALAQARAAGIFTAAHQGYWDAARRQHGDAAGTRTLIEVLLAHRTLPAAALAAAMAKAVSSGVAGCPGRAHRRPPPGGQAGRARDPDRRAGPLRPPGPVPGRL